MFKGSIRVNYKRFYKGLYEAYKGSKIRFCKGLFKALSSGGSGLVFGD